MNPSDASLSSTIAAIATPRGTGGVAIIRLSGPQSWQIAQSLSRTQKDWQPKRVYHDWVIDPTDQREVDEVLFLPFQGLHSFTGEDVVEIHTHGGLYLSKMILTLCFTQGAEAATAGEFTRRALLNGRLDLTQAESILDLIHAQGEALVKVSSYNLHHRAIGNLLEDYLRQISRVQADLTASIDFPDEVDEPPRLPLVTQLHQLVETIENHRRIAQRNQVLRDGLEVAIIGLPNAGKSSLFNALLLSERSIVTDIAGTTRDIIREILSLKGIPVTLVDTAGLRETLDPIEVLGVERTWGSVETAHTVIYVLDGTTGFSAEDKALLAKVHPKAGLMVCNKQDSSRFHPDLPATLKRDFPGWSVLTVSAQGGLGIDQVFEWLETTLESLPDTREVDYLLSHRQLKHLETVQAEVEDAAQALSEEAIPLDLATVPLTNALLELQALLGHDTTELVLDSVFERFCVGK